MFAPFTIVFGARQGTYGAMPATHRAPGVTESGRVSEPANAGASTPSRTPAGLADGGPGHADTINSYPARAACFAHLRDHAVRLMKRHGGHSLRRRCGAQGYGSNSDQQSDHWFSPIIGDAVAAKCHSPKARRLSGAVDATTKAPAEARHVVISFHIRRHELWPPHLSEHETDARAR